MVSNLQCIDMNLVEQEGQVARSYEKCFPKNDTSYTRVASRSSHHHENQTKIEDVNQPGKDVSQVAIINYTDAMQASSAANEPDQLYLERNTKFDSKYQRSVNANIRNLE